MSIQNVERSRIGGLISISLRIIHFDRPGIYTTPDIFKFKQIDISRACAWG